MLRFFLIRFILPLIAFLVIRYVIKSVLASYKSSVPAPGGTQAGGELKRDPVCGTYVAAESAFTRIVDGRPVHFCSAACRDRYRPA